MSILSPFHFRPAQECQKIFKATLPMDHEQAKAKVFCYLPFWGTIMIFTFNEPLDFRNYSKPHQPHIYDRLLPKQGWHRLEKYLNIQDFLEKSLKIKFALRSTGKAL